MEDEPIYGLSSYNIIEEKFSQKGHYQIENEIDINYMKVFVYLYYCTVNKIKSH